MSIYKFKLNNEIYIRYKNRLRQKYMATSYFWK